VEDGAKHHIKKAQAKMFNFNQAMDAYSEPRMVRIMALRSYGKDIEI
jgi:hypothetical protein